MPQPFKIESLLSARLFMSPQLVGDRLYFISDMGGRMSLYAMDATGSVPEPLLPRDIALQNPTLHDGDAFHVFPRLGKILLMIDHDGDENYQPTLIPLAGGIPEYLFEERFSGQQVVLLACDPDRNLCVFRVDPRHDPMCPAFLVDLERRTLTDLGASPYGNFCDGHSVDYAKLILVDGYTAGDNTLYLWQAGSEGRTLLFGVPLADREVGQTVPLNSIHDVQFVAAESSVLFVTSLFDDHYGLGFFPLADPTAVQAVSIEGTEHSGEGELEHLIPLSGEHYLLLYNIDGVSWAYEGEFDAVALKFQIKRTICGTAPLSAGVLQHINYAKAEDGFAFSFSTAQSPAQLFTITGPDRVIRQTTHERVIGIPAAMLAFGEDASYASHDGLRISARLYLPSPALGLPAPYPVIFYIHGGPQSQERPDFTWFSLPLIQFLTLNGFAVWVPNARGSHGYGLNFMKRVDHDWGGQDRLDHVAAIEALRKDPRIDVTRAGVIGRSYGGYMTLTLAGRHPQLWRAAVDMFGPYNLTTFINRLPEAWKTYFHLAVGNPATDSAFLDERSPSTYLGQLACPMLVIQGRNDPRVVEPESRDLVDTMRRQGKTIEYLVFENEGHDVIKFENKALCYNEITRFFANHLLS